MPRYYQRTYSNSRNGRSHKPYLHYTEENLIKTIRAVENGTLSIGTASETYDVPKTTIWRKLNNRNCSQEKAGRPTLFSESEEKCFIKLNGDF